MDQFVEAYQAGLRRYADFSGRTSLGGFWRFVAMNLLIAFGLFILAAVADVFAVLYFLFALAVLVPSLAIAVRRLHDTGKSGWFLFLGLIPLVGSILLIVFYVQPSTGANDYGQGPED